jgi:hypothetical protein
MQYQIYHISGEHVGNYGEKYRPFGKSILNDSCSTLIVESLYETALLMQFGYTLVENKNSDAYC